MTWNQLSILSSVNIVITPLKRVERFYIQNIADKRGEKTRDLLKMWQRQRKTSVNYYSMS